MSFCCTLRSILSSQSPNVSHLKQSHLFLLTRSINTSSVLACPNVFQQFRQGSLKHYLIQEERKKKMSELDRIQSGWEGLKKESKWWYEEKK